PDPVLHRAAGVQVLELGEQLAGDVSREPGEAHDRRVPDELQHGGVRAARHRRPSLDAPAACPGSVPTVTVYVEADRLEAGLGHILDSPAELGTVELVV